MRKRSDRIVSAGVRARRLLIASLFAVLLAGLTGLVFADEDENTDFFEEAYDGFEAEDAEAFLEVEESDEDLQDIFFDEDELLTDEEDFIVIDDVSVQDDEPAEDLTVSDDEAMASDDPALPAPETPDAPAEDAETERFSGECGMVPGSVFWELDEQGTLHIFGRGRMMDWKEAKEVPWAFAADRITALEVEKGVTSIGGYAFSLCTALKSVRI